VPYPDKRYARRLVYYNEFMDQQTQHKLAESLTADTTDIIPYLPYLLQDFWELGSSPGDMAALVKKYIDTNIHKRFLDLGCGKGAVGITLVEEFGVQVTGIDIIHEFIEEARSKAQEHGVSELTSFETGDITETVKTKRGYDCVIFGAVGTVLGNPAELLPQLAQTIKQGGYILLDDAYIEENATKIEVHADTDYLPLSSWEKEFEHAELEVVARITNDDTTHDIKEDYDEEFSWIEARANELAEQYPQHKEMFDHYVINQRNEYDDLLGDVVGATWLLRKR
jgi:2-polyprenyl-3-methyl-5-hydroxy-6-metoxy-1,4-benzoquinol methylase